MNPDYPIFIPTKGRYNTPYTINAFQRLDVPFQIVIEEEERSDYLQVVEPSQILILPFSNKGLVPARNWIWDYAENLNTPYFWTFDDNIRDFYRLNKNIKARMGSGTFLKAIEDFARRYKNLAISGMQYEMFAPRKKKHPPLIMNTRVYSNMLIKTDIPYRNRGIYNDDTDLCLRVLKGGWCTALFLAFLADKIWTMQVPGGNTPIYQDDGRLKMARSLKQQHPKLVKIRWKWGRWQHVVDYRPFKYNELIKKEGIVIPEGINNYGMELVHIS